MDANNRTKLPESPLQIVSATLRLAGFYVIFACLWVLFSDKIARLLATDSAQLETLLAWKHILFVAITLLLSWLGARRLILRLQDHAAAERRRQEENRRTCHYLSTIVESSHDAIFARDLQSRYLMLNPGASHVVGKDADSIIGHDVSFIFPPDQAERIRSHDRQVIAENRILLREYELTAANGEKRAFLETKGPLRDENGDITGIFGIARDITAQKQSEEELRKDEANFRALFEENSTPILLIDHASREILGANLAALAFYGYPKEQFLRMHIDDVSLASPENVAEALQQAAKGERKVRNTAHRLASGELRDIELHATHIVREGRSILLAIVLDVTQRKKVEQSLRESEERLRLALTASNQGWFDIDLKSGSITVSHEYLAMAGYERDDFPATMEALLAHAHPEDRDAVFSRLLAGSKSGETFAIEYRQRRKSGDYHWVRSIGKVVEWDAKGYADRLIGVQIDITERKELEEQIKQLAFFDPLTALPNRRLLQDRLSHAMAASKRSGRYCAMMFADLDNFKPLNDVHGHEVGDLLLIEVARRLTRCVRAMDTVARFGGDEFVIMICELDTDKSASASQARAVAEKIRTELAQPYILAALDENGQERIIEHRCTASIGITLFSDHLASHADILKEADVAMYTAKEAGRNMVRFHELDGG